jgi:predicted transcriptional regulator
MTLNFSHDGTVKSNFGIRIYNRLSLPRNFYQGLNGNELLVYLALFDLADEKNARLRIAHSTLKTITGLSRNTVMKSIESLKEKKLVKEINKGKKYRGTSVGSLYEVYQWQNIKSEIVNT